MIPVVKPLDASTPTETNISNSTPEGLPKLIIDDFGIPMVLIPIGPFEMGSEDSEDDEKPVHTITLNDFYIDQYEVTNALYSECVQAGVCSPPRIPRLTLGRAILGISNMQTIR